MNNLQFYMAIEFGTVQKMLQLVCTFCVVFYILPKRKQNNKTQTWNNSQNPVLIFGLFWTCLLYTSDAADE